MNHSERSKPAVVAYLALGASVAAMVLMLVMDRFWTGAAMSGPEGSVVVIPGLPGLLINSGILLLIAWFVLYLVYLFFRSQKIAYASSAAVIAALVLLGSGQIGYIMGWGT